MDSTYEEIYKGIEKELKIEQEKARIDKDTSEEADKELCEANLEQLFLEVVTEIVDQRMKMEDDESKNETGKGIPWLIELLKVKHKTQNMGYPSVEGRGQNVKNSSKDNSLEKGKGQNSSVNTSKGKRKKQTKDKGKGKSKDKQKPTKGKDKDKGNPPPPFLPLSPLPPSPLPPSLSLPKGKGKTSGLRKERTKAKEKRPISPQSQKARHERFQFKDHASS